MNYLNLSPSHKFLQLTQFIRSSTLLNTHSNIRNWSIIIHNHNLLIPTLLEFTDIKPGDLIHVKYNKNDALIYDASVYLNTKFLSIFNKIPPNTTHAKFSLSLKY